MIEFNYRDEIVSSPAVIVSGRVNTFSHGVITFVNNGNRVFPPASFEVNNSYFKALLHVSPDEPNVFNAEFWGGARLNADGVPIQQHAITDRGELVLHYKPLPANKPLHLCVVLGRDSDGSYDMPKYKVDRGERANLATAVQRLKVAGRMMQAFTQDEFHRLGLSNRSFQFVEEFSNSSDLYPGPAPQRGHDEVKVHVLRSPKTVAELRDPDYAQQNPHAKDNGFLFGHAIDLINQSEFMEPYRATNAAIQCAVMYLDSTWTGSLVTTHAALGGGTGEVKMAIFGSHGLHSFPLTFSHVSPSFADDTVLTTNEVANDSNQCGTSWECLNICMGAFMHEIGHQFGSPHQVDGVMLRDYIWWNRQFMTREARCLRDNSAGKVVGNDGCFDKHCHWNIMDLMRYFYHGSFALPTDVNDPSFLKQESTLMDPASGGAVPSMYVTTPGNVVIKSASGIFMVEFVGNDLARHHTVFHPQTYGGPGLQHELKLNFDDCLRQFRQGGGGDDSDFHLRVLSVTGDLWAPDFRSRCFPSADAYIHNDFNLGRGSVRGVKSELLGSPNGDMRFIGFDAARVYRVRVYHGGALDGITFYYTGSGIPENENYGAPKGSLKNSLKGFFSHSDAKPHAAGHSPAGEVTIGNQTNNYTDFAIPKGERISKLSFRNGQWVDAVQIHTDRFTVSPMLGNAQGGHLSVLEPPGNHSIVGLYGYTGNWMDGVGLIYADV